MTKLQQKPILHGRDHAPGGVDPIPGIGGLSFDTYPQNGGWLFAETTDASEAGGSPSGFGIELDDSSAGGIHIDAGDATIHLNEYGDQQARIEAVDDIVVGAGQKFIATGVEGVSVFANENGAFFGTRDAAFLTQGPAVLGYDPGAGGSGTDGMFVHLENKKAIIHIRGSDEFDATPAVLVVDASTPSAVTYHIQTGATWVADL